jgi:hypothetical protein
VISPREGERERRGYERENDTADILTDQGYRVHQQPTPQETADARAATGDVGRPGTRPDYLIEGRVFDCYAPARDTNVRNAWSEVRRKPRAGQTQRVVINLQDWGGDLDALRRQFADWPIQGLKEVKAVTADRSIVEIWHTGKGAH